MDAPLGCVSLCKPSPSLSFASSQQRLFGKDVLLKLGAPSTSNRSSQPEMLATALFWSCLEHVGHSGGEIQTFLGYEVAR